MPKLFMRERNIAKLGCDTGLHASAMLRRTSKALPRSTKL